MMAYRRTSNISNEYFCSELADNHIAGVIQPAI